MLAGQVASNKAGPGVMISFALAALASTFSAICYAEFAGRVPRAGSAYAYSYITVGEFVAFIIGWNLILEYVIGAASVARGFSGYLRFVYDLVAQSLTASITNGTSLFDSLELTQSAPVTMAVTHNATPSSRFFPISDNRTTNTETSGDLISSMERFMEPLSGSTTNVTLTAGTASVIELLSDYLVEYFDWVSVAIVIAITVLILFGVKDSTTVTLAFTAVNIIVVITVVISSLSYIELKNWRLPKEEIPQGFGEGGFLPYGWSGVLAGSATCFFGFIGFDTIASSAEEAKNPRKNVPLAILLSLFISFLAYMAVAVVQTLLWPYYDQNRVTILPFIFERLDMPITYWIVLLGAIAGLASSQLGGMYPLPRILYSMAQDKLVYSSLAHVNQRLKLPVRATIVGSIFIALLACLLDIQDLADMVSIGTLAAYSLVSIAVLIVRYESRNGELDTIALGQRLSIADIMSTTSDSSSDGTKSQQDCPGDAQTNLRKEQLHSMAILSEETSHTQTPKLESKPSLPVREKGSKPVVAQLSYYWCKSREMNIEGANGTECQLNKKKRNNEGQDCKKRLKAMLNLLIVWTSDDCLKDQLPNAETGYQSKILIYMLVLLTTIVDIVALCLTSSHVNRTTRAENYLIRAIVEQPYVDPRTVLLCTGSTIIIAIFAILLMLSRLPTSKPTHPDMFQVPLVPLIPALSITVNTFLMLNLGILTWIRFSIWMAIGLFIYFTYGIWNSEGYILRLN